MSLCILIHLSLYIYAVKLLLTGPSLGVSKLFTGPSQSYSLGQGHFRTVQIGVSGNFFLFSYHCVFFGVPNYLAIF